MRQFEELPPVLEVFRKSGRCTFLRELRTDGVVVYLFAREDGQAVTWSGCPAGIVLSGYLSFRPGLPQVQFVPVFAGQEPLAAHPSDRGLIIVAVPECLGSEDLARLVRKMGPLPFSMKQGPRNSWTLLDDWCDEEFVSLEGSASRTEYGFFSLGCCRLEDGNTIPSLLVCGASEATASFVTSYMVHGCDFPSDLPRDTRTLSVLLRVDVDGQQKLPVPTDATGRQHVGIHPTRLYVEDSQRRRHLWMVETEGTPCDPRPVFYPRRKVTVIYSAEYAKTGRRMAPDKAIEDVLIDGKSVQHFDRPMQAVSRCCLLFLELAREKKRALTSTELEERIEQRYVLGQPAEGSETRSVSTRMNELTTFLDQNGIAYDKSTAKRPFLYRLPGAFVEEDPPIARRPALASAEGGAAPRAAAPLP